MYTMHANPSVQEGPRQQVPTVPFKFCPIHATIDLLGKKWTLLILRDIAFRKISRFNRIRRSLPGLTARVLTLRLQELEEGGFIRARVIKENPRVVDWEPTEKGKDTLPILMAFLAFGTKWCAGEVFEDGVPRSIEDLYPPAALWKM